MDSSIDMDDEVEIILQQDSVEVTEPLVADYILPTATASTLGGVKIGDNINIASDGIISVPVATTTSKGVVQAGTGITIDANGVISATGEYTLPQATKTTLGGVYVDDALNTSSLNPVQNAVVSLELDSIDTTVGNVSSTVSGLSTTVGNLSTTVGTLNTTVGTLNTTVTNQGNLISNNTSNITSINNRLGTVEGDVTNLNLVAATLQTETSDVYTYNDIDDQVWTAGSISRCAYGMNGYINIDLTGSLTIASGASETIYTLPDLLPEYDVSGLALTDDGVLKISITSGGVITLENISSSSITLSTLVSNIPIIIASDNT